MERQLTIQELHNKLEVMLAKNIDPDTPVVVPDESFPEEDGDWYLTVDNMREGYATFFDYNLKDTVTRHAIILS